MLRKVVHIIIVFALAVLPLAQGGVFACAQIFSPVASASSAHSGQGIAVDASSQSQGGMPNCPACDGSGFKANSPVSAQCLQNCASVPTTAVTALIVPQHPVHDVFDLPERNVPASKLALQPPVPPPKPISL